MRANVVCPGWTVTEMADEGMAAFGAASYVNGTVIPVDGSAAAVDVGTLPFDPRIEIRRQDGS